MYLSVLCVCIITLVPFWKQTAYKSLSMLGLTVEYMLNKSSDDLSDNYAEHHSLLQPPKQYFSSISLNSVF